MYDLNIETSTIKNDKIYDKIILIKYEEYDKK